MPYARDGYELHRLMANRNGPATQGSAMLGAMLGGGNQARYQDIYNRNALGGARLADVMAQARQRQQQQVAREALAQEAEKNGDHELAQLVMGSTSLNPNEYYQGRGHQQHNAQSAEVFSRAHDPNLNQNVQNNLLAALEGKPQVLTHVEDNTVVNPTQTPDRQALTTTDLGQAMIGLHGAQAGAANAAAGAERALADVRRGKIAGPAAAKPLSTEQIKANFGTPDAMGRTTVDPAKMAAFEQFVGLRAPSDPSLENQPHALTKYVNEVGFDPNERPPGSIDPTAGLSDDAAAALTRMAPAPASPPAQNPLSAAFAGQAAAPQSASIPAGAKQAADGKYYVPDPNRPGKYLRVD